jgi:hypothetical protein
MPKALTLTIRTVVYIIRTLLILALAAGALWFAFETAMNISNIYILTTDGLQKRANHVLLGKDEELEKYFSERFLQNDYALNTDNYDNLGIKNFDYKIKVEWAFAYPWDTKGTATVTERIVSLDTAANEATAEDAAEEPVWGDGRYELTFVKNEEGRWYIDEMLLTEKPEPSNTMPLLTLPPDYVHPTPAPSSSSAPASMELPGILRPFVPATPTPSPEVLLPPPPGPTP